MIYGEIAYLKDEDPITRNRAVMLLGKRGPDAIEAIPSLLLTLKDPVWRVRCNAIVAISRIDTTGTLCINDIRNCLDDEDGCVRHEAFNFIIGIIKNEKSHELLSPELFVDHLKDPREDVRVSAVRILGSFGPAARVTLEKIVNALGDPSEDVRTWSLDALDSMGQAAVPAIQSICNLLKDGNSSIRRDAASTLGRIGPAAKDAVSSLVESLHDQDPHVRFHSAYALTLIEPGEFGELAAGVLRETLGSINSDERRLAARALASRKGASSAGEGQGAGSG